MELLMGKFIILIICQSKLNWFYWIDDYLQFVHNILLKFGHKNVIEIESIEVVRWINN